MEILVEAISHNSVHANEIVVRLKAAGREIPLENEQRV